MVKPTEIRLTRLSRHPQPEEEGNEPKSSQSIVERSINDHSHRPCIMYRKLDAGIVLL